MGDQFDRDPRYKKNQKLLEKLSLGGKRVLGGRLVPKGQFLDCVAVGCDTRWGCSGTLIGPNVVLTAGHCADVATRIGIGRNVNDINDLKIVAVKERYLHPDYQPDHRNDLTVLVLDQLVTNVDSRKLAPKSLIDKATTGRVVGFGTVNRDGNLGYGEKRYVDLPVASTACQGKVEGVDDAGFYGCFLELELVAGRTDLEQDSCRGDSGGPFYIENAKGAWLLAAAVSRATRGAKHVCGDGGIYVRIDRYRSWIESIPGIELAK